MLLVCPEKWETYRIYYTDRNLELYTGKIEKTSNYIQKETIAMDVATNLFTKVDDGTINLNNQFDYFQSSAKDKNPES